MKLQSLGRLLGANPEPQDVRAGSIFRTKQHGDVVETARVIEVVPDPVGILHVRYDLVVERNAQPVTNLETRRILNLKSFTSRFCEAVKA